MTRKVKIQKKESQSSVGAARADHWRLQDAKARFSELVRRVKSEGPQHVTLHGVDTVVVVSAEEFRRLNGDLTGEALIAVMQSAPIKNIELGAQPVHLPVRDVSL